MCRVCKESYPFTARSSWTGIEAGEVFIAFRNAAVLAATLLQSSRNLVESSTGPSFRSRYGLGLSEGRSSSGPESYFLSQVRPVLKLNVVNDGACQGFIQLAEARLKCLDADALSSSPANIKKYNIATEEDVLHLQSKPDFGSELSPQEAEELTCYLTAPHLAAPLFVKFFCGDRVGCLQSTELQALLESVIFEALEWQNEEPELDRVPCLSREMLGTRLGAAMEEAKFGGSLLTLLHKLCDSVVSRCCKDCGDRMENLLLFCICISCRFMDMCIASTSNSKGSVSEELHALNALLRSKALVKLRSWCHTAKAERNLGRAVTLQCYIALLNAVTIQLSQLQTTADSSSAIHEFFDSSAFVVAWHKKMPATQVSDDSKLFSSLVPVCAVFGKLQSLRSFLVGWANGLDVTSLNSLCDGVASSSLFPATCKECSRWSTVSNAPLLCSRKISSDHPYPPSLYWTETITFPGASSINLLFDPASSTQKDRDIVTISYPGCSSVIQYSGPKGSTWPGVGCPALNIAGDTFTIEFQSSLNPQALNWGFELLAVAPVCNASAQVLAEQYSEFGVDFLMAQKSLEMTGNVVDDARCLLIDSENRQKIYQWKVEHHVAQKGHPGHSSAEPGLFQDSMGHLQVCLQTSETFLLNRTSQPIPILIQNHPDFQEAIGQNASFCTTVSRTSHRLRLSVIGIDGSCYDLSSWTPLKPAGIVGKGRGAKLVDVASEITSDDGTSSAFNLPTRTSSFSYCGHHFIPYVRGSSSVSHIFDDIIKQGHEFVYCATNLDASDLQGLFLIEVSPSRILIDAKVDLSEVEGHPGSWFEVRVQSGIMQVFLLFENGRNMHRRIVYCSNERYCLSSLRKRVEKAKEPPSTARRQEVGSPFDGLFNENGQIMSIPGVGKLKHNYVSSLSISRALTRPGIDKAWPPAAFADKGFPSDGVEEFVSPQAMYGIVPECLLDAYTFWRTEKYIIRGYLKSAKDKFAQSLLIALTDNSCASVQKLLGYQVVGHLVNPLMYDEDVTGALKDLVRVVTVLDTSSHVLIWNANTKITCVELPRLNIQFSLNKNGRLILDDHDDLSICLSPPSHMLQLLPDVAATRIVPLVNSQEQYFLLMPNFGLKKREVKACPFYTSLVIERSGSWYSSVQKRFFLYPVHSSFSYVEQPSLSAALYWSLVCFLAGNYSSACKTLNSACQSDVPFSQEQRWIIKNFPDAGLVNAFLQ